MKKQFFRKGSSLSSGAFGGRPSLLRTGSGLIPLGSVIAVVLLFILLRTLAPGAITSVVTPLWRAGSGATAAAGNLGTVTTSKSVLAARADTLARENAALKNQNDGLTAQNKDLLKLVGSRSVPAERIAAGVLARPPVAPYDMLIVDAGSLAGVGAGALVFADGGVPVGTVNAAASGSSRISLFSVSGRETEGWIGESRLPVTLTGAGAGAFTATVAKDANIEAGSPVYLPGPGAVPVGTVVHVDIDPSSPKALLKIQPAFNLFSATWVEIARSAP